MISPCPEAGQLVEVRRRQWVVADVRGSGLAQAAGLNGQNLVDLVSLDEDSLEETLSVVWEIEPGARILETVGLPTVDGWDDWDRLEAFLDSVRWGAATNADRTLLQAPFRSGAKIEDFQLDPLVRAIDMARVSLLIADDVGLGKTIEAGLVIQELLVRHRARSVFVVCPASLQIKWRTEMLEKFGLEFRIVDTEYIRRLRRERGIHANPWTSYPRLISSIDWMKSGEGLHLLKDALPGPMSYPRKFDILVVDEAHNVAPSAATQYAMPSQRTLLIRRLAPHFEHRLFLTATPHNGYQGCFTALLELLDDQRFVRGVMPEPKQLQRVMVRRLKADIVDADGDPVFPKREILPLEIRYSTEEREAHRLLRDYIASRSGSRQGAGSGFGMDFILSLLKKRLFSSPLAFAVTLEKHRRVLEGSPPSARRRVEERILRRIISRAEEDYADESEVERIHGEAVEVASRMIPPLTGEQASILRRLSEWAERAKNGPDSKAETILAWLDDHIRTDGEPNEERVVLFTEYRATHSWLHQILASSGWGGDRLMTLYGGMDPKEREKIKAAFQAHPAISPVRILLATDAASEGIDLQNHCHYLIHVEIPWNPNVLEQRNGRIDRHGQREKTVRIWHPVGMPPKHEAVPAGSEPGDPEGDHEFLMRAVRKVDAIRHDLGSVGSVIARQIEEAMLGKRTELDTAEAEVRAEKARRVLPAERQLKERTERLHRHLLETREALHLTPERVQRTLAIALEVAGKPPLEAVGLAGAPEAAAFKVPILTGSWQQTTEGLEHPLTGARRPITFDHEAVLGRDDVVLAHLHHRLVQMALRLLRAEMWAAFELRNLTRVMVRSIPLSLSQEPVAVIWSRLVITGGGHYRLHEELTLAGGELKATGFTRIRGIGRLEELLSATGTIRPTEPVFEVLRRRFAQAETAALAAIEARSNDRLEFLTNSLDRRRRSEEEDLQEVLRDLMKTIQEELAAADRPEQMALWPLDERQQLESDLGALRARLERIPEEMELELAAIGRRYVSPVERTFPVAVGFLVPEGFQGGT